MLHTLTRFQFDHILFAEDKMMKRNLFFAIGSGVLVSVFAMFCYKTLSERGAVNFNIVEIPVHITKSEDVIPGLNSFLMADDKGNPVSCSFSFSAKSDSLSGYLSGAIDWGDKKIILDEMGMIDRMRDLSCPQYKNKKGILMFPVVTEAEFKRVQSTLKTQQTARNVAVFFGYDLL